MSKRRKWMLVGLLVGLVILGIGVGANVYAASSDSSTQTTSPQDTFAQKVAGILGVDQSKVSDAIKQARQEMRDEYFQQRLDQAVQEGTITQDEADQLLKWWQSRPDSLEKLGGSGCGRGHMRHWQESDETQQSS